MNKEKQIEEMAKAVEQARIKATDTTNSMNYGFGGWYAKELYNAGYRKASDVAREIIEIIEDTIEGYSPSEWHEGYNAALKDLATGFKKKYTEGNDNV